MFLLINSAILRSTNVTDRVIARLDASLTPGQFLRNMWEKGDNGINLFSLPNISSPLLSKGLQQPARYHSVDPKVELLL
jgi:hypothetical protein